MIVALIFGVDFAQFFVILNVENVNILYIGRGIRLFKLKYSCNR